jgi:hypothetical protein
MRQTIRAAMVSVALVATGGAQAKSYSSTEASSALKEALDIASTNVVGQVGKPGGFWKDEAIRIALPGPLKKMGKILKLTDKAGLTGNLHQKLNEAAENAAPKALPLFKSAIKDMSVTDAVKIVTGPDDAATQYFRQAMGTPLKTQMRPVIADSLKGVDAFGAANKIVSKYKLPIKGLSNDDLTNYVNDKAADGIFLYIAQEEKKIRANPLKTGSTILKKVFGAL